jgi:hypothetical protein
MHKQSLVLAGAAVLLLALTGRSGAGIKPTFYHEQCAWNATDIFVASQQDKSVTVLETWQGNLAKGTVIQGLDLPAMPLEVSSWDAKAPRKTVSGKRVVLFLKHPDAEAGAAPAPEWVGAGDCDRTNVSAVWIEAGQAYAIQQAINPGPQGLWPLDSSPPIPWYAEPTEDGVKQATLEILAAKEALAKAVLMADVAERLKTLEPMAASKYRRQQREAIAAMGQCGPAALPILKKILRQYGQNTPELMEALAQAAGDRAGEEMTVLVKKELTFWRRAAPDLPIGWRNSLPDNRDKYLERYSILRKALKGVGQAHHVAARDLVREVKDFWASLPQLSDDPRTNEMILECDRVLRALNDPAPAGS